MSTWEATNAHMNLSTGNYILDNLNAPKHHSHILNMFHCSVNYNMQYILQSMRL